MVAHPIHPPDQGCALCEAAVPFDLPDPVVEACLNERLLVFAGAGISTESRLVFPYTFYEDICLRINVNPNDGVPFQKVMSKFEKERGGKELLQRIRARLDYCRSFPEVLGMATRFHCELGPIWQVSDIVTTNWDDFFELVCGAIPIVAPSDYAFSDLPGRRVFKIHGSINNPGSIIATQEDYDRCYRRLRSGVIGSSLKHLLATRTVLFVGFSFSDPDFERIYRFIRGQLGRSLPMQYVVTLGGSGLARFPGITLIHTDGTHFLAQLKAELVRREAMLPDDMVDSVSRQLSRVRKEHNRLFRSGRKQDHPEMIYAAFYQDGLLHAFERIVSLWMTGYYCNVDNIDRVLRGYEAARKTKLASRAYKDVAYIDGYVCGHKYLISEETRKRLPLYYVFGNRKPLVDFKDYEPVAARASDLHKAAYRFAENFAKRHPHAEVTHTPFLL